MTYQLIALSDLNCEGEPICLHHVSADMAPLFLEGAILAANFTTQPLAPAEWLAQVDWLKLSDEAEPLLDKSVKAIEPMITEQINKQYHHLKLGDYSALAWLNNRDEWRAFAEGFMSVWPMVESQWINAPINDGSLRMLQALLTTLILAIDETQTQLQLQEAGFETPSTLHDFSEQLDMMIAEVAYAADEQMLGNKTQKINPFKQMGRNDLCSCQSGKKFKRCCGH